MFLCKSSWCISIHCFFPSRPLSASVSIVTGYAFIHFLAGIATYSSSSRTTKECPLCVEAWSGREVDQRHSRPQWDSVCCRREGVKRVNKKIQPLVRAALRHYACHYGTKGCVCSARLLSLLNRASENCICFSVEFHEENHRQGNL